MMKHLLVCLFAIVLVASVLAKPASAQSGRPPNIIFILADDLGYGDLSCYGQTKFQTPNIDALAERGMRFTQHYSGSAVCAPSRCSLMTGLHTGHTPVKGNAEHAPEGQMPMPADTFTIGHLLQSAGYKTGVFGKWGLGYPGSASAPLKMGFDRFYGYNCQRIAHCYYPAFLWNDDKRELLWGNVASHSRDYAPDLIHDKAIEFIRENKDQPFFCYYAAIQPHADMIAPDEYMGRYRGKFLPEFDYPGDYYLPQPEGHAAFAAMVAVLDDYVGEVMAELDDLGIADNTLVVFSSDNGPHEEGGHDPKYFDSNAVMKGVKRDLYEGGVRVPMIAVWPDQIAAGSQSDHVCAFWDFMPTMAELAGVSLQRDTDGISIVPTLLNRSNQEQHAYLYWDFPAKGGREAMRRGDWKAVRYNLKQNPDAPIELYNLTNDVGETNDVADSHPEVVQEIGSLMQEARSR
ncbi:arylsulfatase [Rhodopirellula sallentina]|uniref:Arylsulfatase n=1 Tax=Rhodopirellula sallentina SM41 TaxID=1263870 RepID=M5U4P5_9BACT|nr:arylsulfatase [Rhodopirellula sallentina]EMI56432.1 arylsulfatase [Rhodopirellula sallentina SM41]